MVAAARRRLAQAVATLARQASTSSGAARGGSCLVFDSRATTTSLAQGGLARNKFPWSKVSLGFAAAGLMTVAQPPSAGCTATATADPKAAAAASAPPKVSPPKAADNPTRHKVVFVLGGPGSGKGTQSARLVEEFGVMHLSAGDLLRAHMKSGSPDGLMVADMIKNGQIVPSHVTISLLQAAMDESGKHKFLIDGFPRNEENRASFEAQTGIEPDFILFFDCPEAVMEARLLGRNEGRSDDNIDTIRKRFKVFLESSMPVIQHYEAQGKVVRINADRDAEDIYKEVRRAFLEF